MPWRVTIDPEDRVVADAGTSGFDPKTDSQPPLPKGLCVQALHPCCLLLETLHLRGGPHGCLALSNSDKPRSENRRHQRIACLSWARKPLKAGARFLPRGKRTYRPSVRKPRRAIRLPDPAHHAADGGLLGLSYKVEAAMSASRTFRKSCSRPAGGIWNHPSERTSTSKGTDHTPGFLCATDGAIVPKDHFTIRPGRTFRHLVAEAAN